jgi:adenylate cyclase
MRSNVDAIRPEKGKRARAKIIEYPRKRLTMPGSIESHASLPSSDARTREISAYLSRLLTTPQFTSGSRRGQLLSYLVEHTLAGDADKISEYAIGLEVFQKPTSFDPRIESLVRTEFSRLRQRLKEYYAEEGARDPIVIDFPPRSYAATFEFRDTTEAARPVTMPPRPQAAPEPRQARWMLVLSLAAIAAAAALGYVVWRHHVAMQAAQLPIHALVVLPFENYSPDHQDEYIADGLTEELTNDLAQWRDLRVVARTSAFAFKGKSEDVRTIGQVLGVDAVLEGSFTKQGDQMRITAQLDRTADGYDLWSHTYETQAGNLLDVQEQVANSIASAIRQVGGGGTGTPPQIRPSTTNAKAHDLYLQGEYQFNLHTPQSMRKSVDLFNAALIEDPSFARAYIGLGDAYLGLTSLTAMTNAESFPAIRQAAQKAIELDPNLGDAHGLLANVDYVWGWDWDTAEAEFRRGIAVGAGPTTHARYGWMLASRGRFNEAHEQESLAAEEDPLSLVVVFDEFYADYFARDSAGEEKTLARMEQLQPNFLAPYALREDLALIGHDCKTARKEADWQAKNYADLPVIQAGLALAAACEGNKPEALTRLHRMEAQKDPAYQVAIVYLLLHDTNDAFAQLNKSADAREIQILYLKYDPYWDEIRNDPRFIALERRVGLS